MPKVITVRIPEELAQRLDPLHINVSEICRNALESEARTHENIEDALSQEDVMKGLIQRLKLQKASADATGYHQGQEDGQEWGIRQATYKELQYWGPNRTMYRAARNLWEAESPDGYDDDQNPVVVDVFPTGTAQSRLDVRRQAAEKANQVFETKAYQLGFLASVREVWTQVQDEFGPEWNTAWIPEKG